MRYSTVFVAAAFAAGAMARAVPEAGRGEITEGPTEGPTEYPTEGPTEYPTEGPTEYPTSEYPTSAPKYEPKKDTYPSKTDTYPSKMDEEYAPVKKSSYEDKKSSEGTSYKPYFPAPVYKDEKKSCYGDFKWPTNVKADKPCDIKWGPKEGSWKKEDDTVIYIYKCNDYSKPYEKVCDSCGDGEHKEWKPKSDCQPSDSEGGATYRFKFCKKSDEDSYTWGEEFPIWNDEYYKAKPTEKPVENQCPPPAPVPVYKAEAAPAAYPSAEAAPAAAYPSEAAAPVAAAAPYAATNETAPAPEVAFNGSGALRASISVIVGVAALVTFAL